MIVLFSGSRRVNDYDFFKAAVAESGFDISFIIHGAHWEGIDKLANKYANEIGLFPDRCLEVPAQWQKYGFKAGPFRNHPMVHIAEGIIALPDSKSRGTLDVINYANSLNMISDPKALDRKVFVKWYKG